MHCTKSGGRSCQVAVVVNKKKIKIPLNKENDYYLNAATENTCRNSKIYNDFKNQDDILFSFEKLNKVLAENLMTFNGITLFKISKYALKIKFYLFCTHLFKLKNKIKPVFVIPQNINLLLLLIIN